MAADLSCEFLPGFKLSNPLMIASSHLTASENAFKHLSRVRPSAVTVKTTSTRSGGTGSGQRRRTEVRDFDRKTIGIYTDGPRSFEFWNLDATARHLALARERLPESLIGLSVLQEAGDYSYDELARQVAETAFDYVEFNLKIHVRQPLGLPPANRQSGRSSKIKPGTSTRCLAMP
jgi:dihydroorotate dehydrogenase